MRLPRGIFVKLVTVFLVIGLLPFVLIGFSAYQKAKERMTQTVVKYWLVRMARETAVQLDREVQEMRGMVRSWADDQFLAEAVDVQVSEGEPKRRARLCEFLDSRRKYRKDIDLLLLVGPDRSILAESWCAADGSDGGERRLAGRKFDELTSDPYEHQFIDSALVPSEEALRQDQVPVSTRDWHVSPLVRASRGEGPWNLAKDGYPKTVQDYGVGFASTVMHDVTRRRVGALVAIFNWSRIQGVLDQVAARFHDADDPSNPTGLHYPSGYPFLFAENTDTIIAHDTRENLGTSLAKDHHLVAFQERMRGAFWGSYEYDYPANVRKISGFARTAGPTKDGFGWMVGVGIPYDEIFADVISLRNFLLVSALIVTGLVILMAAISSHRITEPIRRLIAWTATVAKGNLDERLDIRTNDEIAVLADSFNKMAEDLKEQRSRLVRAEKDAAWKEMARQVAHEIKNPLTPIVLSAQQLKKAHDDRHAEFDDILKDSVTTIIDQCESLRRIAADFAVYAGSPRRHPKPENLIDILQAAVDLYRPRAGSDVAVGFHVSIARDTQILADKDEMRRVFLNLFNNAMEAMEGRPGRIDVGTKTADGPTGRNRVMISVTDTGQGIPKESRAKLFQPYFSTRTSGTGLGLAICKKIVEEHDGTITFESEPGAGTTFLITLPTLPLA